MSIAIINASIGNSLSVAGTSTLSGALTSASSINCQGITSSSLQVNGPNSTVSGIRINGTMILTGDLQCIPLYQTTGTDNLAIGHRNLEVVSTGSHNYGIGYETLGQLQSGNFNIAYGYQSGGGVLGNENICIGRNAGIEPDNFFNQSVCIGINSKITASNQITLGTENENVKILGNFDLNGSILAGSSTISNTQLGYVSGATSNIQTQLNIMSTKSLAISSNVTVLQTKTTGINYTMGNVTTINGNVNVSGSSAFNVGSNGQLIVREKVLTYSDWAASYGTAGLQIGWNNDVGSGGTDFINNAQIGSGNAFSFWRVNNITDSAVKLASITSTGIGKFNGLVINDSVPIYLRNTTSSTFLAWDSTVDGPSLQGYGGGKLGTHINTSMLSWNNSIVKLSSPLEMSTSNALIRMNGSPLYFGYLGDVETFLQISSVGTSIQSKSGGRIGTTSKSDIITWNSTSGVNTVGVNGNLQIAATNEIRMNNAPIYLKTTGDDNHVLRYVGGTFDGPSLQGYNGGTLRTVSNPAVLTWSDTSVNMNLPLLCNNSIQQSQSGYCVNFYRKTNCTTSETFNFQLYHGKFEVFYNANHDRNTTAHIIVDILNNINNGSFIIETFRGNSVFINIDVNTNILRIDCTLPGGTLQINRLMAYY